MKVTHSFLFIAIIVLAAACKKDSFKTKPQISIKSYSSKTIGPGDVMRIVLEYTDKEGDLGNAQLFAAKIRLNQILPPIALRQTDTFRLTLPTFPDKNKGTITFALDQGALKEHLVQNDTIQFRLAVKDAKGNASDTLTSDKIVIVK